MPSAYDEILNVFDDQGLGEAGLTGWDPDQIPHPVTVEVRGNPPAPTPRPAPSLQGVAAAAGLAGLIFGLLFGRR